MFLLLFFFAVTAHVLKTEPSFISRSETFKFISGDIIKLPCDVANAGKNYHNYIEYIQHIMLNFNV